MLKTVIWTDAMSVGVTEIDEHHKTLISLINKVLISTYAGVGRSAVIEVLKELEEYTRYHFSFEEEFMAERGYADIVPHRERHTQLLSELAELRQMPPGTGRPVVEFLSRWLTEHIMKSDMDYSRQLGLSGNAPA